MRLCVRNDLALLRVVQPVGKSLTQRDASDRFSRAALVSNTIAAESDTAASTAKNR